MNPTVTFDLNILRGAFLFKFFNFRTWLTKWHPITVTPINQKKLASKKYPPINNKINVKEYIHPTNVVRKFLADTAEFCIPKTSSSL